MAGYVVVVVAAGLGRWWSPAGASLLLGLATAVVLAAAPVLYPARDAAAARALAASAVLFTTADVIYPAPSAPVHLVDRHRPERSTSVPYSAWVATSLLEELSLLAKPICSQSTAWRPIRVSLPTVTFGLGRSPLTWAKTRIGRRTCRPHDAIALFV